MQISEYSFQDSQFPDKLRRLETRTPKQIYVLGELPKPDDKVVAIVGTRSVTPYGKKVTYQLARDLAKAGVVIVSGLARGADGVAHQAALDAGGRTIAVMGTPLDRIYPSEHRGMAMKILETGGALISEYAIGTGVARGMFAARDRIIAGMSDALIVTESASKGGALISARDALNLGLTVMAVPGNITSEKSGGTNKLIREGAILVRSGVDVIEDLGFLTEATKAVPAQSPDEALVIKLIEEGHATGEAIIEASGLTPARFANIITLMEITGKVRNLGAGNWVVR
jgi:DNA processing protein